MAQLDFTEYYAPDGTKFRFHSSWRTLFTEEGYGMPGIDYITQQNPFQHGNTIYDYRLQPRVIQMVFRESACSRAEYFERRAWLLNVLRPNRQGFGQFNLGTLRKILPNNTKRDLKVFIESGPMFAARDLTKWDEFSYTETLRFIAPDPVFFNPIVRVSSGIFSASGQLILPVTFDNEHIIFNDDSGGTGMDIFYVGTWKSFPTITITGPINDPIITNASTGESIELDYNVASGETIVINLEPGYKTITSSISGNLYNNLLPSSDMATFALEPEPTAPNGLNSISMTGTGLTNGLTTISLQYYERYIGL